MVGYHASLVLCLVLLLEVQARVLMSSSPPTIILNINHEITDGLHEGDIVLTEEQKFLRQQRKATHPAKYWPRTSNDTVIIGYRFGDDTIDQQGVKTALSHWEERTCLTFQEVSSDVGYTHLNFVNASFCASYVGWTSFTSGQTVWLHPSCVAEVGPTIHEIGHALGFNHEQSRPDRDTHVIIAWDNVKAGMENNFQKRLTYDYELPYDYWSIMHYGPKDFSSNNRETILACNPLMQPLMGNRFGLSFADTLQANTMYGCLDQWLHECSLTSNPCQNLGYTGSDCLCVCPEGTTGGQCQGLEDSYIDALVKLRTPYSETITTEGVVSTPGYPTPIQTRTEFVKILTAPDGHRVMFTVADFQVYTRVGSCFADALTIRTSNTLGTGRAYCGEEITPNTAFISERRTLVLHYYNYDYSSVNWVSPYRGFNATIQHIPAHQSTPATEPSTTADPLGWPCNNTGDVTLVTDPSPNGVCSLGCLPELVVSFIVVAGELLQLWLSFDDTRSL